MSQCKYCGKKIKFRNVNGVRYAVDAKETDFLPDPNGKYQFISRFGVLIRGEPAHDGQYGNVVHLCEGAKAAAGSSASKQTSLI